MRLFLLAWRNLQRNRQRTVISALSVVLGVFACVVLQGLSTAFVTSLIAAKVESKLGAIHVFRKGYLQADEPLNFSLPWDSDLVARIQQVPGVKAVAPRMEFDGLISNGSEATMFQATAIEPALEDAVCPKRRIFVAEGSDGLRPGRHGDMLLGQTLAESLGAAKGSTLVLQAAGPHASTNALDLEIRGFLRAVDFVESTRSAVVPMQFAQDLLRMPGRVTSYAIGVHDLQRVDPIARHLRAVLGDDYDVATWDQLDAGTKMRVLTAQYTFFLVALVLFLLAASGIINTMLMAVYERVREIGTMLSMGTRRIQITILFLWEAALNGFLSALCGAALGYGVVSLLAVRGIQGPMAGGDVVTLYPRVGLSFLVGVVACAVLGAILAGLYPAWKAARLRPVEALSAT